MIDLFLSLKASKDDVEQVVNALKRSKCSAVIQFDERLIRTNASTETVKKLMRHYKIQSWSNIDFRPRFRT